MNPDPTYAAAGSDFYYASLYRPAADRERERLLDAIMRQVSAIPLSVSDRGVARVKLDWWHSEAAALADGQARHDLTRSYCERCGRGEDIAPALHALVKGLDDELGGQQFATRAEQTAWFETTFGPVYRLHTQAAAAAVEDVEPVWDEFARCIETGYALLQVKALALRQLYRFPLDALAAAGCTWDDLIEGSNAEAAIRFVSSEAAHIGSGLAACRARLPDASRPRARTLSTLAAIVERTLAEMLSDGCRVWQHRVALTPVRKLWCALRYRWA